MLDEINCVTISVSAAVPAPAHQILGEIWLQLLAVLVGDDIAAGSSGISGNNDAALKAATNNRSTSRCSCGNGHALGGKKLVSLKVIEGKTGHCVLNWQRLMAVCGG